MNVPTLLLCICTSVCRLQPLLCSPIPPDIFDTWLQGFSHIFAAPSWLISPIHCVYYKSLWLCLIPFSSLTVSPVSAWEQDIPLPGNVFAVSLQHGVLYLGSNHKDIAHSFVCIWLLTNFTH